MPASSPADLAPHPVPLTPEQLRGLTTPAYLYDLAQVRANWAGLRAALPRETDVYYSLKANPHPAVLRQLLAAGAEAEVCSPGELASAVAAGWPASRLLYGGPGKRDVDLEHALRHGVRRFSVDSPVALDQLDRVAGRLGLSCRALLRINDDAPVRGQGLTMSGVASQFGADEGWVVAEPGQFAGRTNVTVDGLHFYMGTNLTDPDDLVGQFARSLATAVRVTAALTRHGMLLRTLDLGGGFGAPYASVGGPIELRGLTGALNRLLDEHVPGWRDHRPHVVFESGRYLVGTAGTLLTRVLDVKRSHGTTVAVLDSGINHLGGMAGLRRLPPLRPTLVRVLDPASRPELDETVPTMIAGPLCTPLDTWARATPMPSLCPGDILAVPNVGAYGLSASLVAFLGHPLPSEVVVDSDQPSAAPSASRLELVRVDAPYPFDHRH